MTDSKNKKKGSAEPVDKHVGQRLRTRRSLLGMSQEKLADKVGITFQQIQKYERGVNRISSSRLFQFSKILNVPIDYFFNDIEKAGVQHGLSDNDQDGFEGDNSQDDDIMNRKETLKLVRAYYGISNPKLRQSVLDHIKILSKTDNDSEE